LPTDTTTTPTTGSSQLIDSVKASAGTGQLQSFSLFESKDPFNAGGPTSPTGGAKSGGSGGTTSKPPKTPPAPPTPPVPAPTSADGTRYTLTLLPQGTTPSATPPAAGTTPETTTTTTSGG